MTDATKASEVAERLEAKAEQHRFAASQSSLGDGSPYKDAAELFEAAASLIRALNERVERLEGALRGAVGALEFSRDYHKDLGNEEQAFAQDRLDAALNAISATGRA